MVPQLSNAFTFTATADGDFVIAFFYEWQETDDGVNVEFKREKVRSILVGDACVRDLVNSLNNYFARKEILSA